MTALLETLPMLRRVWLHLALAAALAIAMAAAGHFRARAVANAAALRSQADQFKQAQAGALAAWNHERARLEFQSRVQAHQGEVIHDQYQTAARRAAAAYADNQRLRTQAAARAASPAPAATPDHDPSLRQGLPADPQLAISQADLQACTDVTAYALGLRAWVLGVGEREALRDRTIR